MLAQLNKKLWNWLSTWNTRWEKMEIEAAIQRTEHRLLVFFHGYSLAHTIRPLVIARLAAPARVRGYLRRAGAALRPNHRRRLHGLGC